MLNEDNTLKHKIIKIIGGKYNNKNTQNSYWYKGTIKIWFEIKWYNISRWFHIKYLNLKILILKVKIKHKKN